MIEFHCWVNLRYDDYHDLDSEQKKFMLSFKSFLNQDYPDILKRGLANFFEMNGASFFRLNGINNRRTDPFPPLEIMNWLKENGCGSFGLLYIYDHVSEKSKGFKVLVLKRGKLVEYDDPFLSPFFPECENPFMPDVPPLD